MRIDVPYIFVVNVHRHKERWEAMLRAFPDDRLIRVPGIDGWDRTLTTGHTVSDNVTLPAWRYDVLDDLIQGGDVHRSVDTNRFAPTSFGCNTGHIRAVKSFLKTGTEWGIVLEDDVELTGRVRSLSAVDIPDDCDFFYLCSADHPGKRLVLKSCSDTRVWHSRTFMGYALNRKAAKIYLDAATPMTSLLDFQISVRCFDTLEYLRHRWLPDDVKRGPTFVARGTHTRGYIRHSVLAKQSTMVRDGTVKTWLSPEKDIR